MTGTVESLSTDNSLVKESRESGSLPLNSSKCETISSTLEIADGYSATSPGASTINLDDSIQFGGPLCSRAIDLIINKKLEDLYKVEGRINTVDTHEDFFFLPYQVSNLTEVLTDSPSCNVFDEYYDTLKSTFEKTFITSV